MKVCVVGLGEIGSTVAEYLIERGCEVFGYDINYAKSSISKLRIIEDLHDIPDVDVFIVATSSCSVEDAVKSVFSSCALVFPHALVSIESTVPLGTCRRLKSLLGETRLVHCPHRYWREDKVAHGVKQMRVIGAVTEADLEAGYDFYTSVGIPLTHCSSVEIAELSKLVENSHYYIQIALAEELRLLCDKLSLSYDELASACNTKWNVKLLEARDGIGGHCLPKDIRFLINSCGIQEPSLFATVIAVDEKYRKALQ